MYTVTHNMLAWNAGRQLKITNDKKAKSSEKLSSGYRINRAADDAAGLAISEKMRRQIRGLNRGITNTQEGISMIQVGDGALNEVHDILHRMEELAVQSANDTNDSVDREALQKEVGGLLDEIDRIGNDTEFNKIPLFQGRYIEVYESDGSPVISGNLPVTSYSVTNVNLGINPFMNVTDPDSLNLTAVIANGAASGISCRLIYGSGITSHSSVRATNAGGVTKNIRLENFVVDANSYSYNSSSNTWARKMTYSDSDFNLELEQTIHAVDNGNEKYYQVSYALKNRDNSAIDALFMFNADTSYGGDGRGDHEESYYMNGTMVSRTTVYSSTDSPLTPDSSVYGSSSFHYGSIPSDFDLSIINTQKALGFSERISFDNTSDITNFSMGRWTHTREWSFYDTSALRSELGTDIVNKDIEFSVVWNMGSIAAGGSKTESLNYGIIGTSSDSNLTGVSIRRDDSIVLRHDSELPIWIQSGSEVGDGMFITFGEMNVEVLGLAGFNISTQGNAESSISDIAGALKYVSDMRSRLGAYQNRLSYTVQSKENAAENTTSAESLIRDANMAAEMVEYSKHNLLEQAGFSVLSQANQTTQGVLNLLQ